MDGLKFIFPEKHLHSIITLFSIILKSAHDIYHCRKFANAEENDLWSAMAKATLSDPTLKDLNVVDFMNSWTKQAGYPVVKVNRNYATGKIEFEQVRIVFSNAELSLTGSLCLTEHQPRVMNI